MANGIIIIDKPAGLDQSMDVCAKLRGMPPTKRRMGRAGTLDPQMATSVCCRCSWAGPPGRWSPAAEDGEGGA